MHRRAAGRASAQTGVGELDNLAGFFGFFVVAKVKFELVVVRFFVVFDDDVRREWPAGFGAKALQRANFVRCQQCFGLVRLEGTASGRFAKREAAGFSAVFANAGVAAVVFFDYTAAVRAGRFKARVVAGDGVAVVLFGFFDHALGHGGNFLHEGLTRQQAFFHLRQLVLPLAGQVSARQLFDFQAAQQRHQLHRFGGGDDFAAFAQHVFFGQQALDGGRARGGRAQAFFLHRLAHGFVFNLLAGAFHRAQQRGFGVARRRLGFERFGIDFAGQRALARLHRHQVLTLVAFFGIRHFTGNFFAVNRQPSRLDQHLAFGLEMLGLTRLFDLADARRHQIFGAGEEHRHKAAHHQVVELLLGFGQLAGRLQRRDDGKVVGDFGVVKNAFVRLDIAAAQCRLRVRCQVRHAACGQHLKGLLGHGHVVFRQGARVGARIGQRFVALVQSLRQRQRGFGGKAKLAVGLALQAGQVKQLAGRLGGGLAFFRHRGGLAARGVGNGQRLFG